MRKIKNEAKHYLETKILGAYETADIVWQSDSKGDYHRMFDDTFVTQEEDKLVAERTMWVDGKTFTVCSVFSKLAASTPTDKMLRVLDGKLKEDV